MLSIGDFVGLPFSARGRDRSGVDCWGLVCLVFAGCRGIELPGYDDRYTSLSNAELADRALIIEEEASRWQRVLSPFDVERYDCALFSRHGRPAHIGVVVRHGVMLHIEQGATSVVESYLDPKWQPRFIGHYRYA